MKPKEVEHWLGEGRGSAAESSQTPNALSGWLGVGLWGISSIVERGTAQINS